MTSASAALDRYCVYEQFVR